MAILVTETGGNFSTATWYRAEAYNLDSSSGASALSSDRYSVFTFSNAGNLRGCVVSVGNYTATAVPVGRWARLGIQGGNTATLPVASPGIVTQAGHGFVGSISGVTISNGSPAVITYAGHGLREGDWVGFTTTGSLPSGVTAGTRYYVRYLDADTFNISATAKGVLINTSTAGSGTHSMWTEWVQFTTTGALPTGVTANTVYCVKYINANTYNLSTTAGGTNINFTGSTSGTHTAWHNKEFSFASTGDIYGTGQQYAQAGCHLVPMYFSGTKAVTTTASGWRWYFSQTDGSGSNIYMFSSATPTQFFIAWCDTTQAWSSGDCPVICSPTTYDTTTQFTGTVRWYSGYSSATNALAGLICTPAAANRAYSSSGGGNAMFKWDDTATHTLTIDGMVLVGTHAGVYVGTEDAPIAYANKAIINLTIPPTFAGSSTNYSGFTQNDNSNNYYGGGTTFVYSGDYPTQRYATLTADANTGQPDLIVDDASGFAINDYVYISKHNAVYGSSINTSRYQIQNIVGTTITLTGNVTGENRLTGGRVILLERGYGVQIYSSSLTNYATGAVRGHGIANVYMKGVYTRGLYHVAGYSTSYRFSDNTANLRATGWYIGYSICENYQNAQSSSCAIIAIVYANHLGGTIEHVLAVACAGVSYFSNYTIAQAAGVTRKCGPFTVSNCFQMRSATSGLGIGSGSGLPAAVMSNNIVHNSTIGIYVGQNNTWTNCYAYGCTYGTYFTNSYFAKLTDTTIDRCSYGWYPGATGINLIKVLDTRTTITNIVTKAFTLFADMYADYDFVDAKYDLTDLDTTYQADIVQGSEFRVTNNNSTTNDDVVIDANGLKRRCGTALADTTVYGTNSYSWRLAPNNQPVAETYEWIESIGNQQNYDMFAYVWIKINSANYYAATHQLPRLTVTYDQTSVAYSQAAQSTSWQQLIVPFKPLTTYSSVTLVLSGYTDATGADAYFYLGAKGIVLPAGRAYDNGALSYWASAKPLTGLATSLSAFDVWSVPTSQLTGSGTIGKLMSKCLTVAKFLGLK